MKGRTAICSSPFLLEVKTMTKTATQYFLQALFEHFCYHDDYLGEASNDPHDVLFDDDGLTAFAVLIVGKRNYF